jgi:S-DNA-T family DNA segregation ATPase FtsK/SpoIIIE
MARRRKQVAPPSSRPFFDDLSPHTKQAIGAIFFVVLGLFFVLSSLGIAGVAGEFTHGVLVYLFGYGFILAPILCALFVYAFMKPRDDSQVSLSKFFGSTIFFIGALGMLELTMDHGGLLGTAAHYPLHALFGTVVSSIVLIALILVGLFVTFNTNFVALFTRADTTDDEPEEDIEPIVQNPLPEAPEAESEQPISDQDTAGEQPRKKKLTERLGITKISGDEFIVSSFRGTYAPPPLSLLHKDKGRADVGDVKANSMTIKRTLKKFNIDVEMDEVTIGATVTRYAIKPAEGVKLEKIVSLQTNLEYALAASPIRIEAPIPGKSLVGIEIPNRQKQMIGLASLFSSPEYTDSPKPLLTALGKRITGEAEFVDIARMPHGLIAGTTGSGKSVAIHNLIISLLYRNSPDQLRFILVDPKRVELTLYNGIPHLLSPVIIEPKKVILALKWAVKEMERRLELLSDNKVQNISSYHEKIYRPAKQKFEEDGSPEESRAALPEPLPYIVIMIDELADLMHSYPKELEACIVRLAQMSRAAGIHLILSTQRPSVNVITGLIKANIPTRIALNVASQIDSRTILDQPGAEKLLGRGDMLFLSSDSPKPMRLQSAFVSEDEVKKVVTYLKDMGNEGLLDTIDLSGKGEKSDIFTGMVDSDGDDADDDLYEDARLAVIEAGRASTSYLQRKLRVGYGRAARLMDMLTERGVIAPSDGTSKPRQILEGGPQDNEPL